MEIAELKKSNIDDTPEASLRTYWNIRFLFFYNKSTVPIWLVTLVYEIILMDHCYLAQWVPKPISLHKRQLFWIMIPES